MRSSRIVSYLGFPSYKIIVPGFSETGGYVRFCDRKNSDWFANRTHEAMRNIEAADDILLSDMFIYHGMIYGLKSHENCAKCFLRDKCRCETVRELYKKVGKKYLGFTDGQNRNEFLDGLPL